MFFLSKAIHILFVNGCKTASGSTLWQLWLNKVTKTGLHGMSTLPTEAGMTKIPLQTKQPNHTFIIMFLGYLNLS